MTLEEEAAMLVRSGKVTPRQREREGAFTRAYEWIDWRLYLIGKRQRGGK